MGLFNKEPQEDYSVIVSNLRFQLDKSKVENETLKQTISSLQQSIKQLQEQSDKLKQDIEIARGIRKKENKRTFVQVRCTYQDKEMLVKKAEAMGFTLTHLCLEAVKQYKPTINQQGDLNNE